MIITNKEIYYPYSRMYNSVMDISENLGTAYYYLSITYNDIS